MTKYLMQKIRLINYKGRLDAARETLEKQWECKTVEDAYTKLEELKQRRETMQEKNKRCDGTIGGRL